MRQEQEVPEIFLSDGAIIQAEYEGSGRTLEFRVVKAIAASFDGKPNTILERICDGRHNGRVEVVDPETVMHGRTYRGIKFSGGNGETNP